MNIDTHINNSIRFIKEQPLYALLGGIIVLVMNVATLGVLSGPIIGGYLWGVLQYLRNNRKPQIADTFAGFQRLGYLFSFIIVTILTILSFVLFIIPGLIVMTWWIFVLLLMVDTDIPLSKAMAESRKKVQEKGFFMHFVFILILTILPTLIINVLSAFLPPLRLLQVLVMPFQSACLTSLYMEQFSTAVPPPVNHIAE